MTSDGNRKGSEPAGRQLFSFATQFIFLFFLFTGRGMPCPPTRCGGANCNPYLWLKILSHLHLNLEAEPKLWFSGGHNIYLQIQSPKNSYGKLQWVFQIFHFVADYNQTFHLWRSQSKSFHIIFIFSTNSHPHPHKYLLLIWLISNYASLIFYCFASLKGTMEIDSILWFKFFLWIIFL